MTNVRCSHKCLISPLEMCCLHYHRNTGGWSSLCVSEGHKERSFMLFRHCSPGLSSKCCNLHLRSTTTIRPPVSKLLIETWAPGDSLQQNYVSYGLPRPALSVLCSRFSGLLLWHLGIHFGNLRGFFVRKECVLELMEDVVLRWIRDVCFRKSTLQLYLLGGNSATEEVWSRQNTASHGLLWVLAPRSSVGWPFVYIHWPLFLTPLLYLLLDWGVLLIPCSASIPLLMFLPTGPGPVLTSSPVVYQHLDHSPWYNSIAF